MNKEEILHTYLLANIPECISQEEFDDVKGAIKELLSENKELHNKTEKAIEVIHTQMKNNPSYKENLKIIENNLIKGSCKVCDLKDSDVDE